MKKNYILLLFILTLVSCNNETIEQQYTTKQKIKNKNNICEINTYSYVKNPEFIVNEFVYDTYFFTSNTDSIEIYLEIEKEKAIEFKQVYLKLHNDGKKK